MPSRSRPQEAPIESSVLSDHWCLIVHPQLTRKIRIFIDGDKSLECLICQRSFRRRDILAKHLRAHSTSETEATGVEVTRNSEESVEETLQEADAEAGPDAASFINETAGFDMNDYLQEEAFDTTGNATLSFPRLFAGENSFGFVDDDYLFNYDPISFIRNLQPVLEDESEIGRREMVLSMPAIPSQHETANDFTNFNITSSLSLESLPQLLEALPVRMHMTIIETASADILLPLV
jgi:hypothetical protein